VLHDEISQVRSCWRALPCADCAHVQYQQSPYNLQKIPVLRERLEQCIQAPMITDDEAYRVSLEIEPRE
jgi:hypothetical protein